MGNNDKIADVGIPALLHALQLATHGLFQSPWFRHYLQAAFLIYTQKRLDIQHTPHNRSGGRYSPTVPEMRKGIYCEPMAYLQAMRKHLLSQFANLHPQCLQPRRFMHQEAFPHGSTQCVNAVDATLGVSLAQFITSKTRTIDGAGHAGREA